MINEQIGDGSKNGKATTGLVLGIIGLLAWILPLIGAPITIIGLIFGIKGLKSLKRGVAITAIVLSCIGLFATIVNASIGAYLGVTRQHEEVNRILNRDQQQEASQQQTNNPVSETNTLKR